VDVKALDLVALLMTMMRISSLVMLASDTVILSDRIYTFILTNQTQVSLENWLKHFTNILLLLRSHKNNIRCISAVQCN